MPRDPRPAAVLPVLNRRRWLQRLGLAGGTLAAGPVAAGPDTPAPQPAAPRPGADRGLRLGVVARPGSALEAAAQRCALGLAQRLGERVRLQPLAPGSDAAARWGADARGPDLLLAEAWRLGPEPVWRGAGEAATNGLGPAQPLAVLSRAPLLLAANRLLPKSLPALLDAAPADAAGWRCGIDGSDALAAEAAAWCLQQAGLGAIEAVSFRGASQLLPALAGARLQMAVVVGPDAMHGPDCGPDRAAPDGDSRRWAAAHLAGDVTLIAVADAVRLPGLPEVPTLNEALGSEGREAARCRVLLAAPGLPARRLQRLAGAAAGLAACRRRDAEPGPRRPGVGGGA